MSFAPAELLSKPFEATIFQGNLEKQALAALTENGYTDDEQIKLADMIDSAEFVIGRVVDQPENRNRQGGCLVIWKRDRETPLTYAVGKMSKPNKYPIFALAKAKVLRDFLPDASLSGKNLQLPEEERFKLIYDNQPIDIPHRAVATKDGWIISFSGFEQEWDAAAVLAIAVKSEVMGIDEATEIAEKSVSPSQEKTIASCLKILKPQKEPSGV
jgi:hypothetical protein